MEAIANGALPNLQKLSLHHNPAGGAALDAIAVAIVNLTNLRKLDLRSFTAAGGADEARRERVRKAAREGATVMF